MKPTIAANYHKPKPKLKKKLSSYWNDEIWDSASALARDARWHGLNKDCHTVSSKNYGSILIILQLHCNLKISKTLYCMICDFEVSCARWYDVERVKNDIAINEHIVSIVDNATQRIFVIYIQMLLYIFSCLRSILHSY